jgi:uncharacterized membrane protein
MADRDQSQRNDEKMERRRSPYPAALRPAWLTPLLQPSYLNLLLILAFAIFFSLLAVQQHRAFETHGLDLGNVDQALWNTAQGRFLHFTLMAPNFSRLALHVEPILLLFVPLYWLGLGGPELLLVVQAVVVALGAWPVYQLAMSSYQLTISDQKAANPDYPTQSKSTHLNPTSNIPPSQIPDLKPQIPDPRSQIPTPNSYLPLLLPLAYLLLPTLESAVLFDFHAVTLASTFLLFAFWALERKKAISFVIFAVLAMATKEDMPLVVAMLGLYAGLARRQWRLAGLTIGLSLAWFWVAFFVIQPRFAGGGNIQLDRYAWLGDSPSEMIRTLITQPALIFDHVWYQAGLPGYLVDLFFPTAFLAFFSPLTLLPLLPTLAVNMLSANPFTWRLEDFHYGAALAPFLFISAIYGIRQIACWTNHRLARPVVTILTLLLLAVSAVYHYERGYTPLARPYRWPEVTDHHRTLTDVIRTIPPETVLFTQSNLAPHLSQRRIIYGDFAYFTDSNFPALDPVDDILLDVTGFENMGGLHQFLRQTLLDSGDYRIVSARDGIIHLQPAAGQVTTEGNDEASQLPAEFYSFVYPTSPPQVQLPVDFGDLVRLKGYTLHFNRQEEIQLDLDLEALRPLEDAQPVLYLLDAGGQPLGATVDRQPLLVWFPPAQWPAGQTVRVRFSTFPWHTRQMEAYRLALGLISGDDAWDVSRRRRPAITANTPFTTRLPAGGALIELAHIEQIWQIPTGGPTLRQLTTPNIPHPLTANFDNQIRLLGYSDPIPHPTSQISITLHWQAIASPPQLIRFVQLIGPDGQVYVQNDSVPDHGLYPTSLWQPGEFVSETVTLPVPAERPPGSYTLHLGLYDPDTGQRLPLRSGGDHVEIDHTLYYVE